jgi:hypothetical protein
MAAQIVMPQRLVRYPASCASGAKAHVMNAIAAAHLATENCIWQQKLPKSHSAAITPGISSFVVLL